MGIAWETKTEKHPKIQISIATCRLGYRRQKMTVEVNKAKKLVKDFRKFRQDHDLKRKPHIHVGHTGLHEFQSLLKNFLESKQLKIGEDLTENSIERRKERLGKPTDHNVNYLRDKELANEWRDFHGKNANRRKI